MCRSTVDKSTEHRRVSQCKKERSTSTPGGPPGPVLPSSVPPPAAGACPPSPAAMSDSLSGEQVSDFKAAFSLFGEGPVGGALGNFFVTAPVVCVRESRAACWVVGGYVFVGAGIGGLSDSLLRPPPRWDGPRGTFNIYFYLPVI